MWEGPINALANYGWPAMEGPCDIGSITSCSSQAKFQDPAYYYEHTKHTEEGAVTGGVFVPPDGIWPEEYKYLFVDFIYGEMYNLIEDASLECQTCVPPIPGYRNETFHEIEGAVDVFFGPYNGIQQALYIVARTEGQNIRRIRYTGTSNRSPVANFTVDATSAMAGDVLSFDGSASYDPDGDSLAFLWDFGDGITSTAITRQHAYTENGSYTVTLTVTDGGGLFDRCQQYLRILSTCTCTAPLSTVP